VWNNLDLISMPAIHEKPAKLRGQISATQLILSSQMVVGSPNPSLVANGHILDSQTLQDNKDF
jgi:hypothetical protein